MKNFALVTCFGLLLVGSLRAQEVQRFTGGIGAGFTQPVGNTGRNLDMGWNIQGGAGYNFSPYFGAMVDASYNSFGINSATLNNFGVPDGAVHVFSATLGPIIHLNPHGHVDLYLVGGAGLYRVQQEFTQPALATATGFDPFFGFYPVTVPVNQVLSSYSVNKPGVNVGAGIGLGSKWHGKFFGEARYARVYMGAYRRHMDYLPITFGFRW